MQEVPVYFLFSGERMYNGPSTGVFFLVLHFEEILTSGPCVIEQHSSVLSGTFKAAEEMLFI